MGQRREARDHQTAQDERESLSQTLRSYTPRARQDDRSGNEGSAPRGQREITIRTQVGERHETRGGKEGNRQPRQAEGDHRLLRPPQTPDRKRNQKHQQNRGNDRRLQDDVDDGYDVTRGRGQRQERPCEPIRPGRQRRQEVERVAVANRRGARRHPAQDEGSENQEVRSHQHDLRADEPQPCRPAGLATPIHDPQAGDRERRCDRRRLLGTESQCE